MKESIYDIDIYSKEYKTILAKTKETEEELDEFLENRELNICDKCDVIESTYDLAWIDSEDFEPLDTDTFNKTKFLKAIKKGYSALCEDCYNNECCK